MGVVGVVGVGVVVVDDEEEDDEAFRFLTPFDFRIDFLFAASGGATFVVMSERYLERGKWSSHVSRKRTSTVSFCDINFGFATN